MKRSFNSWPNNELVDEFSNMLLRRADYKTEEIGRVRDEILRRMNAATNNDHAQRAFFEHLQ